MTAIPNVDRSNGVRGCRGSSIIAAKSPPHLHRHKTMTGRNLLYLPRNSLPGQMPSSIVGDERHASGISTRKRSLPMSAPPSEKIGREPASLTVQAISTHPLLVRAVEGILTNVKEFPYLPSVPNEKEARKRTNFARLFLLDACCFDLDVGLIADRCRASSPGSKFIALLAPTKGDDADRIRLLHHGIDGFVELSESWETELPQAIRSVLGGQYWVHPQILRAFFKQAQVLEPRLLRGNSLTVREREILLLLMRRLTNKEISRQLDIAERTVKFHVTHILAKFGCEDRHGLHDRLPWIYVDQEEERFQLEQGQAIKNRKTLKRA